MTCAKSLEVVEIKGINIPVPTSISAQASKLYIFLSMEKRIAERYQGERKGVEELPIPCNVVWKGVNYFPFKSHFSIIKSCTILLVFHLRVLPASGRTTGSAHVLRAGVKETLGRSWARARPSFYNREVPNGEILQLLQRTQWTVLLRTILQIPSRKRTLHHLEQV